MDKKISACLYRAHTFPISNIWILKAKHRAFNRLSLRNSGCFMRVSTVPYQSVCPTSLLLSLFLFIPECTLYDLKKMFPNGCLPLKDAIYFFAQIVSGLAYLHSKGIVHKDIKGLFLFLFSYKILELDLIRKYCNCSIDCKLWWYIGLYRIAIYKIRPEPYLPDFLNEIRPDDPTLPDFSST